MEEKGTKKEKTFYKKWWFWLIILAIILAIILIIIFTNNNVDGVGTAGISKEEFDKIEVGKTTNFELNSIIDKKDEINKHKVLFHGGEVLTLNNTMNFSLKLASNPVFTAKVMQAYGIALYRMHESKIYGAFSILDIAPKYLSSDNYIKYI